MNFDLNAILDVDTQRAVFAAVSILSILLLVCCLSKWILYGFTVIFTLYACWLGYFLFIKPKLSKSKKNVVLKDSVRVK